MRPEALEEARDWLLRAQRDMLAVERALSVEPVLHDQAAFHSQQAAEKALKAFLTAHDHPFAKTHNLERLVRLCQSIDPTFVDFMEAAHTLNPYATQFRYPGGPLEVFHCQQAAEKAMKGFLTWHDHPLRKTHSLEEIGGQCLGIDQTLKPLVDRAVSLTDYAWKFCYPGEPEEPSLSESQEAFALAREVYETILSRLPVEVRP